jgi:hypothetical protein
MFDVPPGTVLFRQKASDTEQSLLQLLRGARYVGTVKDRMAGRLFPTPRVDPGDPWTVLLHERWTPAGKHRVVLVEANVMLSAQDVYLDLSVQLFGAGSIPHPIFTVLIIHPADGVHVQGEIPGFPGVLASVARVHYGSDFELLAGRPDPLDPSAFLFDLRNGEKTITIRGRIRDDDALTLSTSDGSLLPLTVASTMKPIN